MNILIRKTLNPKPKPPAARLGFGKYMTDHMFVMDYTTGRGWHDPAIVPYEPLTIDPAAMVFHYGQAVFEGLKAYKAADGRILLFRPERNFARMNTSHNRLCIPEIDEAFALQALKALVKLEEGWIPAEPGTSLYIRPFSIATEAALGVRPSDEYKFMIILSPVGSYYPQGMSPVDICIEDEYVRSVRGGIGFTKGSANYAISLKGQVKALEIGYAQVLWLDGVERKYIEEVGTTNVFFKVNGELMTPELSGSILPGVTRDSIIQLAKSWGMPVRERRVSVDELMAWGKSGALEEAFATGTAAVLSPIGALSYKGERLKVADGGIGQTSQKLYDALVNIQYGRAEDPFGWVVTV